MNADTADWEAARGMKLGDWRPRSQMRAKRTDVVAAAMPAVDIHTHLGRLEDPGVWAVRDVQGLVERMDALNLELLVNLDGQWADELDANIERYDRAHPGRFLTFCNIDFDAFARGEGTAHLVAQLEDSARRGARGVKVFKSLGLGHRDGDGRLLMPDDPRVIPIFQRAGELGLPVLIHTADPLAFFDPLDAANERIDELLENPDWWVGDPGTFPAFDTLYASLDRLLGACPDTVFIGAHVACLAEDLDRVADMLTRHPNFVADIAARLGELGRQPRRFARLVEEFPARVLFGTDENPLISGQFEPYFRFLETTDEGFEYDLAFDIPPTGRWLASGAGLRTAHLRAVYRDNARRILSLR
jgi:predicted TIM-barrel fold metal-dependent hydrolase